MADIVPPDVRSRMMSGIRSVDTKPEMILRQGLHRVGFRFRLHANGLPGKPDMVFSQYRAVIFVNGCFWHGHNCHLFRMPSSRREFWEPKITRNRERDRGVAEKLADLGWRQLVVWECSLKGRQRWRPEEIIATCGDWLRAGGDRLEIRGKEA